jgi:hypothetical protein
MLMKILPETLQRLQVSSVCSKLTVHYLPLISNNYLIKDLVYNRPYQSITDIESFYTYLETVIVPSMFFENLDQPTTLIESMFLRQNVFIGPLRLRQVNSRDRLK